jgi:hypothetical protein
VLVVLASVKWAGVAFSSAGDIPVVGHSLVSADRVLCAEATMLSAMLSETVGVRASTPSVSRAILESVDSRYSAAGKVLARGIVDEAGPPRSKLVLVSRAAGGVGDKLGMSSLARKMASGA